MQQGRRLLDSMGEAGRVATDFFVETRDAVWVREQARTPGAKRVLRLLTDACGASASKN